MTYPSWAVHHSRGSSGGEFWIQCKQCHRHFSNETTRIIQSALTKRERVRSEKVEQRCGAGQQPTADCAQH